MRRGDRSLPDAATTKEIARVALLVSAILKELGAELRPGLITSEIEASAGRLFHGYGLTSRMLHYHGFPNLLAVSGDDVALHGLPSDRALREGELVKIQIGAQGRGASCDQGWTFAVGTVDDERVRLRHAGIAALQAALATLDPNNRVGDLSSAIQTTVEAAGFSCVRAFVGHGIGAKAHEPPQLSCIGKAGTGQRFKRGMILHVNVILAAGGYEVEIDDDKFTVRTADRRPSAIFTAVARVDDIGHTVFTPLLD